jgi:hypothetical protein
VSEVCAIIRQDQLSSAASHVGGGAVTEQQYLEQRLDNQIDWYERKGRRNRLWFLALRAFEIVLAAGIPLLTSVVRDKPDIGILLGSMSVAIAVIAGILALFRFQELWIEYRATAETLKREKFMFLAQSGPYASPGAFGALVERVETLLAAESTKWTGYMRAPSGPAENAKA